MTIKFSYNMSNYNVLQFVHILCFFYSKCACCAYAPRGLCTLVHTSCLIIQYKVFWAAIILTLMLGLGRNLSCTRFDTGYGRGIRIGSTIWKQTPHFEIYFSFFFFVWRRRLELIIIRVVWENEIERSFTDLWLGIDAN